MVVVCERVEEKEEDLVGSTYRRQRIGNVPIHEFGLGVGMHDVHLYYWKTVILHIQD